MKKATNKKKGFSLVELIVVITILAILSVIGMQAVGPIIARSKAQADISNGDVIGNSISRAYAEGKLTSYSTTPIALAGSAAETAYTGNNILADTPALKANSTYAWYYECSDQGVIKVYISGATYAAATAVQVYPSNMDATNLDNLSEYKAAQ